MSGLDKLVSVAAKYGDIQDEIVCEDDVCELALEVIARLEKQVADLVKDNELLTIIKDVIVEWEER